MKFLRHFALGLAFASSAVASVEPANFDMPPLFSVVEKATPHELEGAYLACTAGADRLRREYERMLDGQTRAEAEDHARWIWARQNPNYWDRAFDVARIRMMYDADRQSYAFFQDVYSSLCTITGQYMNT